MNTLLITVLALSALAYFVVKGTDVAQNRIDEKKKEKKAKEQKKPGSVPMGTFFNPRVTAIQAHEEIEKEYFELSYTDLNDYDEYAPLPKSNEELDIMDKELMQDQDFSEKAQNQVNSCIVDDNGELVSPLDLVKVKTDQPSSKVVEETSK